LQVHPTYYHADSAAICDNGFYLWRGRQLRQSGTYYDSLQSRYGCDSVYMLQLQVHPTYYHADSAAICDNGFYLWRGRQLRQSGIYYDSLQSHYGCDSIYMLRLHLRPTYLFIDTIEICAGSSYLWHGQSLSQTGLYHDSLQTEEGCDSIYRLHLNVHPTYFYPETFAICGDETYYWHQRSLSQAGVYFDSLHTQSGCDSVFRLELTVNPLKDTLLYDTLCAGSDYAGYGFQLSAEAISSADSLHFVRILYTVEGCDSTVHLYLHLRFFPFSMDEIVGDSLIFHAGTYCYEVAVQDGIDSCIWSVSNPAWQWETDGWRLCAAITQADTATLTVKGVHQCGETAASTLFVRSSVRVVELEQVSWVQVWPNPVSEKLHLCLPQWAEGTSWRWNLCTMEGKIVKSGLCSQKTLEIPLPDLAKGVYLLRIDAGKERMFTVKISKL
ncbi:MAG: T9SS type A sorting domain-containing protein, partial [Bacteroidales bacterium]|nr:T9SS type A sorting domain-containing protein [Bacteroidales bacterium]